MSSVAPVVCLVDDDASVRKSVARFLESSGFKVDTFSEPEAFLGHLTAHSVPVAILDIWMENMTGMELLAHLTRIGATTALFVDLRPRSSRVRYDRLKQLGNRKQTERGHILPEMFQRTLPSAAIVVCVVNEDASALKSTTEVLSTGYGIRPFRDGDTFLNVEEQMPPAWQLPHAYW